MPGVTTAFPNEGNHASRPGASSGAVLYSCTTHGLVYRSDGTAWTTFLTLSASGMTNPMTTAGDLIVGGASGAPTRLAGSGTDGWVATYDSTATPKVKWAAAGGGGSSGYDLDSYTIDATYGDDFTAASLAGIWTRRNFTAAETFQLGKNTTYMRIPMTGRAIGDAYLQTAPSGDWTFAMAFVPRFWAINVDGWSICVVNSVGTGVGATFTDIGSGYAALATLAITTYSTYGGSFQALTGSTTVANNSYGYDLVKNWIYLRKSGTNYYAANSRDGEIWGPETPAFSSGITVDRIGMIVHPQVGITTTAYIDVDWFNKIA